MSKVSITLPSIQSHVIFSLLLDLYIKIPFKTYSITHTGRELGALASGLFVRLLSHPKPRPQPGSQPSPQGPFAGPSAPGA